MAEIRPDQYQNGDKQKDVEIKRDVKLYLTKSYVIAVFLCISMFNPLFALPPGWLKISWVDAFIMSLWIVRSGTLGDII